MHTYIPKPLLSGSVPQLQFNPQTRLDFDETREKVDSDRRIDHVFELSFREVLEQGRLADGAVADEYQTELVVEDRFDHLWSRLIYDN